MNLSVLGGQMSVTTSQSELYTVRPSSNPRRESIPFISGFFLAKCPDKSLYNKEYFKTVPLPMFSLRWQFFLVSAPILLSFSSIRIHISARSWTCFSLRWLVFISGIVTECLIWPRTQRFRLQVLVDDVFGFVLQVFLLSILKSMFTKEIGLKFSFFVDALCGLGIRLTVVS